MTQFHLDPRYTTVFMMPGTQVDPGPQAGPSAFPTTDAGVTELARPVLVRYLDAIRSGEASTRAEQVDRAQELWTEHLDEAQPDPTADPTGQPVPDSVPLEDLPGRYSVPPEVMGPFKVGTLRAVSAHASGSGPDAAHFADRLARILSTPIVNQPATVVPSSGFTSDRLPAFRYAEEPDARIRPVRPAARLAAYFRLLAAQAELAGAWRDSLPAVRPPTICSPNGAWTAAPGPPRRSSATRGGILLAGPSVRWTYHVGPAGSPGGGTPAEAAVSSRWQSPWTRPGPPWSRCPPSSWTTCWPASS